MEHDWEAARDHYIAAGWLSGVTLQDVAERYGIPYQSVRRRAARDKWRLIREWKSADPDCKTLEEFLHHYR